MKQWISKTSVCLLLGLLLQKISIAQVNSYIFSQTSSLNPGALSGETEIISTNNNDDRTNTTEKRRRFFLDNITSSGQSATGKGFPIGFDFLYDGQVMNSFGASSNGYIKLGDSLQGITMLNDTSFTAFFEPHPERRNIIAAFLRKSYKLQNFNDNRVRINYTTAGYPGEKVLSITFENFIVLTQSPFTYYQTFSYIRLYQYGNKVEVVNNSDIATIMTKDTAVVGLLGSDGNYAVRKVKEGSSTWKTSVNGNANDGFCEFSNALRPVHTSGFNPLGISYNWVPVPSYNLPKSPEAYFKQERSGNPNYIKNATAAYILAENAVDVELNPTLCWAPEYSDNPIQYDVYLGLDSLNLIALAGNLTLNAYQLPSLAANTQYYYKVVAHNTYGVSSSGTYSFTTASGIQYCNPGAVRPDLYEGNGAYKAFTLNTMNYTYAGAFDPKADYPATTYHTSLKRDTAYKFTYTAMTGVPCFALRVWIDFNHNGSLSDPGEQFIGNNASIIVPHDALLGPTKMRIGVLGSCSPGSIWGSCNPNRYQDFIVTIIPSSVCQSFAINQSILLPLCYNDNKGSISVNVSGGSAPYTFTWSKNNSSYAENTGIVTNIGSGAYRCRVTDANGCILQTAVIPITQPLPVKVDTNFVSGIITAIATGGTIPYQFEWKNERGVYTDNPVPGIYTLTVTDANGCSAQLQDIVVSNPVTTNIGAYEEQIYLKIYPNPSDGIFTISGNKNNETIEMIIIDMNGSVIKQQPFTEKEITIDLSGHNKGLYFLKIAYVKGSRIMKLILN